jgi:hypothetical protein
MKRILLSTVLCLATPPVSAADLANKAPAAPGTPAN